MSKFIKIILALVFLMTADMAFAKKRKTDIASADPSESYEIFTHRSSGGSSLAGHRCSARDRDELTCMVCAIYGEDHGSLRGMLAVGGTIMTRVERRFKGGSICSNVHAAGQFVGAWHTLPGSKIVAPIIAAARRAMNSSGNGYLGFRSYGGHGCVARIGGNCFRKSAEMDDDQNIASISEPAQQNSSSAYQQMAELTEESTATAQ